MKPRKRTVTNIRYKVNKLNDFKHLYYSLKFKNKFRQILWEKIRQPKISLKYHPNILIKLLSNIDDDDEETFQNTIDLW
jgi:hypothetical protein